MELTNFLHSGTDSGKLKGDWKFVRSAWSKMDLARLLMDSKIDCV